MLVAAVAVRVKPDVSQSPAVGVLRVSDSRYFQPYEPVSQHALRVVSGHLAEATNWLVGGDGLRGVHADEPHRGAAALGLYRDGVAVDHFGYSAVDLVVSAEAVDQAVEAYPGDRVKEQGEHEGEDYKNSFGVAPRYDAVLVAAREDGDEARGPEELDASEGHHVGEEVGAVAHEDGDHRGGASGDPPQRQAQEGSDEHQGEETV